jgi:hypothetical protein
MWSGADEPAVGQATTSSERPIAMPFFGATALFFGTFLKGRQLGQRRHNVASATYPHGQTRIVA